jgi:hypothetical protein
MQSTFERNGMPQKLAKYAQQIKVNPQLLEGIALKGMA